MYPTQKSLLVRSSKPCSLSHVGGCWGGVKAFTKSLLRCFAEQEGTATTGDGEQSLPGRLQGTFHVGFSSPSRGLDWQELAVLLRPCLCAPLCRPGGGWRPPLAPPLCLSHGVRFLWPALVGYITLVNWLSPVLYIRLFSKSKLVLTAKINETGDYGNGTGLSKQVWKYLACQSVVSLPWKSSKVWAIRCQAFLGLKPLSKSLAFTS